MPTLALLGGPRAVPPDMYPADAPTCYYVIEWMPQDIGLPLTHLDTFGIAVSKAIRAEGVPLDYIGEGCSVFPAPGPDLAPYYVEAFDKVMAWVESHAVDETAYLGSIGD